MNYLILVNTLFEQKGTFTHTPRKTVGYILNGIIRTLLTHFVPCDNAFLTGMRNFIFIGCHHYKKCLLPFFSPSTCNPRNATVAVKERKDFFKTQTPYFLKLEIIEGQFSYNLSTLYPLPELVFTASNSLIFKVKH